MSEGAVAATFLIVFREALEACLIVGIILTVLSRLNQSRYFPHVVGSSFIAIGVSVLAGFVLLSLTDSLQGSIQTILEGSMSLAACGVLTYMIFWMDRQARRIKSELEGRVEEAVTKGEFFAIVSLPFFAVFREGAETALFLNAVAAQNSRAVSFWGGGLGFSLALLLASAIFLGGKKIPLRPFFRGTGLFLLLVSAGLLAYGIHELQEVHLLPTLIYPVWNTNAILNEREGLGAFLKALFGYNGNPSLLEVLAYLLYLVVIPLFLKNSQPTSA